MHRELEMIFRQNTWELGLKIHFDFVSIIWMNKKQGMETPRTASEAVHVGANNLL